MKITQTKDLNHKQRVKSPSKLQSHIKALENALLTLLKILSLEGGEKREREKLCVCDYCGDCLSLYLSQLIKASESPRQIGNSYLSNFLDCYYYRELFISLFLIKTIEI